MTAAATDDGHVECIWRIELSISRYRYIIGLNDGETSKSILYTQCTVALKSLRITE